MAGSLYDLGAIPWRECYDDNYERCYFFNVATGESKWKPPDAPYIPYAADPATDDRTPKTAAATIPAPRRSLSEPPFQGDLQTAPPTPVRDGAPPPPPADVDATPRTKLSAFLQTHAVQQQQ